MNRYIGIIVLIFVSAEGFYDCSTGKFGNKIKTIEIRLSDPIIGDNTYYVYYFGDLTMYQTEYLYDSSIRVMQFDSIMGRLTEKPILLFTEKRVNYFVFHKDSAYGYNFDPIQNQADNVRLRVDSILRIRTLQSNFDTALFVKPDSVFWNADKTELREVYLLPGSNDIPAIRRVLYFSNTLNHLKESFSRKLDLSKNMKLFKIEGFTEQFYGQKDKILWPAMKTESEMKEISIKNSDEIIKYFKRYKKAIRQ